MLKLAKCRTGGMLPRGGESCSKATGLGSGLLPGSSRGGTGQFIGLTLGPLPPEQRTLLVTPAVWFMLGPAGKVGLGGLCAPPGGWTGRAAPAPGLRPRPQGLASWLPGFPAPNPNPKHPPTSPPGRFFPPPSKSRGEASAALPAPSTPGPPRCGGGERSAPRPSPRTAPLLRVYPDLPPYPSTDTEKSRKKPRGFH